MSATDPPVAAGSVAVPSTCAPPSNSPTSHTPSSDMSSSGTSSTGTDIGTDIGTGTGTVARAAVRDSNAIVSGRRFPREARLLNGPAYDAVFGDNRRIADNLWTVLVHRTAPGHSAASGARIGLAIAKKRARRAVDRNRIKRVARESFRHARASLVGHDIVVMNRDAATRASAAELRTALEAIWSRLLRQSTGEGIRSGRQRSARARKGRLDEARDSRPRAAADTAPDRPAGRDGSP